MVYPCRRHPLVTAQGLEVVQAGRRRWIDTHWFRGNSYFRIGLEWAKAALVNGWQLIQQVCFTSYRDPESAIASRPQHNKKADCLDFMVITVKFLPD
ncbi:MAG: hypothetical protein WBA76_12100 [Phormidesmis sp.]